MASYYGNEGPVFILKNSDGSATKKTLKSPNEISSNPWKRVQQQRRDINDILRIEELKYRYEITMTWEPINNNTSLMGDLLEIINWQIQDNRELYFFPFSDKTQIKFPVVVTHGTPSIFSKVSYDSFTITVTSRNLINGVPDPNALGDIDLGGDISVDDDLEIG